MEVRVRGVEREVVETSRRMPMRHCRNRNRRRDGKRHKWHKNLHLRELQKPTGAKLKGAGNARIHGTTGTYSSRPPYPQEIRSRPSVDA